MAELKFTMTAERACEIARNLLYYKRTRYNNSYPYNCAFTGYDGLSRYISGDCWNMFPKCLYWGEALGEPVDEYYNAGHYISPADGSSRTGLPDCTGDVIIDKYCDHVTDDFSDLLPGTLLLIPGVHMGLYVGELGEWTYEGKTYNVIEFTNNSLIGSGCRPSYVDADGNRYSIDRKKTGVWTKAGRFKGFIYKTAELPKTKDFIRAELNYSIIPTLVKGNSYEWMNCWIQEFLAAGGWYKGTIDGIYGDQTEKAVKAFQKDNSLTQRGYINDNDLAVIMEKYYKEEK